MIAVKSLTKTCDACPAQWEGETIDGRMVYVRYRWGYLSVCVSPGPTTDVMDAVGGEEIFGAQLGDGLDGCLDVERLLASTADIVMWPLL